MAVREDQLYLLGVKESGLAPGLRDVTFKTTRGDFTGQLRLSTGVRRGVLVLSDVEGGTDGPCGVFPELTDELVERGVGSLRLSFRAPGDCVQCTIDALLGLQYLDDEGVNDVVLVGWSFGASVALAAGSLGRTVRGIAAVSPKNVLDCCLRWLKSRPLLLVHGDADRVAPVEISRKVYYKTGEPRRLIIYAGAGHNCGEVRDQLRRDLALWIMDVLQPRHSAQASTAFAQPLN